MRFYKTLDGLVKKSNPNKKSKLKSFEINWKLSEDEVPHFEDAEGLVDLGLFNQLENSGDLFYDQISNHEFTKIGGWPSLIQHSLDMEPENMIFQIGSEDKVHLNWVDGGNVYIGFEDDEWKLECQFF